MGKKEKLIARLKTRPKNFTFDEMETLLKSLGYKISNKGKTSGSRITFSGQNLPMVLLHKPHPRKELLSYQIDQILEILESGGLI